MLRIHVQNHPQSLSPFSHFAMQIVVSVFIFQLFVQFIAVSEGVCVCEFFFLPPSFYIFWRKKKKLRLITHLTYQTFIYTCKCFFVCALLLFSNNFFIFCTVMHHTTMYTKRICDHYRKLLQQNITWIEINFWSHLKH